jgi:hypothetical protein
MGTLSGVLGGRGPCAGAPPLLGAAALATPSPVVRVLVLIHGYRVLELSGVLIIGFRVSDFGFELSGF